MRGVYLVHYSMTIWINNTPDVHRLQGDRRHQFDKENFNLREYQKTWLIVDPISVENQIQLEHVSPSLWDLLDRQSFCRWMKVQLSTRLGGWERAIRSELARILTIQSWSRVIINSGRISVIKSGFAETSRIALGCIHVCVPFWCDPGGSRGEHNMGSSRFVRNSNKCRSMQLSNAPLMLMLWWWWW